MKFLLSSLIFKNKKETLKFAKFFSLFLKTIIETEKKELFIFFSGPFGVGKTTLIKSIAKEFNIKENLRSPSFIILKTYKTKINSRNINFHHLDLYRISNKESIFKFLKNYFKKNNIFLIEWGDKFFDLPKYCFILKMEFLDYKEGRKIKVYFKA